MSGEQRIEIKSRLTGEVLLIVDTADLRDADLRHADLRDADLGGANLRGADLRWADLSNADLSNADLNNADLRGVDLSGADLSGANLRGANLRWANLSGADLSGVSLSWAAGNGREVSTLQAGRYHVAVAGERMAIGCETRPIAEWVSLSETQIEQFGAVEWAATWRPVIEAFLAAREKEAANAD